MVVFRDKPLIWFERDEKGDLLLSAHMLTISGESRMWLDANDWHLAGVPSDFESPPSGKRIDVRYSNGDRLAVVFWELENEDDAANRYKHFQRDVWHELPFPLSAVELLMVVGGTSLEFGPTTTRLGGVTITGGLMKNCGAGLVFS
jgi:hypothetical protein